VKKVRRMYDLSQSNEASTKRSDAFCFVTVLYLISLEPCRSACSAELELPVYRLTYLMFMTCAALTGSTRGATAPGPTVFFGEEGVGRKWWDLKFLCPLYN